jgi:hypothetical protein
MHTGDTVEDLSANPSAETLDKLEKRKKRKKKKKEKKKKKKKRKKKTCVCHCDNSLRSLSCGILVI